MTIIPDRLALLDQATRDPEFPERFWRLVDRTGECWEWQGFKAGNGYGRLHVATTSFPAHRVALALSGTLAPLDMDVCHRCDNRPCVRPLRLYVGTRRQNMADCTERDRHNKPRGEKHWRARLSAADVQQMRELTTAGWSRKDLGERFGVNAATVSRIVRGIWRQEVA